MKARERLISYAIKYGGDIRKISKAYLNDEDINYISYDNCFTIFDDIYPKEFYRLAVPPLVLFYKGDLSLLYKDKIGVVGSRVTCDYALKATKDLVLNKKDKVIVSGLAKGIDAYAHKYADKTIGILGCGIDYIYPLENKHLYKKLEKEGLIISEYPYLIKPYKDHFPFRNRLIAALASEVYVMQSRKNSGTFTTINEALTLGKNIKILPYDIYNKEGIFNNYLIEEGASLITIDDLGV